MKFALIRIQKYVDIHEEQTEKYVDGNNVGIC